MAKITKKTTTSRSKEKSEALKLFWAKKKQEQQKLVEYQKIIEEQKNKIQALETFLTKLREYKGNVDTNNIQLTYLSEKLDCCRYFEKAIIFLKGENEFELEKMKQADIQFNFAHWIKTYSKEIENCEICSTRLILWNKVFVVPKQPQTQSQLKPEPKESFLTRILNIKSPR